MLTDSRKIVQRLQKEGWIQVRVRGSHHVFRHPERETLLVVPHPRKDLPLGTVRNIYRSAGWPSD